MVLHVFLVPIISSHDKLWGLARRVFTLFKPGQGGGEEAAEGDAAEVGDGQGEEGENPPN